MHSPTSKKNLNFGYTKPNMGPKSLITSLLISSLLLSLSFAQTCNDYTFTNKIFTTCTALPYLSSYLHWNYHQTNSTVEIAYRHTNVDTSTWVAWALNLEKAEMGGSQCLVAYHNSSSSTPTAYTSALNTGYSTTLARSNLSFEVPSISAEYVGNVMVIYATLVLPTGRTGFNQVWQNGPVSDGVLQVHPLTGDNRLSVGTVDFATGVSTGSTGGGALQRRRNVHGILNAVSWGTLMPLGAMIARYLKVFKSADPAWFYLHVACQSAAYIVGVAGWATGIKLGSDSAGLTYSTHRNIGITLFALGTLQVFALLLRPKKDHKIRIYWNVYHWTVGYLTIILSIINIFEGIDILNPGKNWKRAYIGIIIFLGFNAVMLEAYTWYLVIKRKKTGSDKYPNGANSVNGYVPTMKTVKRMVTDLDFGLLKYVMILMVKASGGAANLARAMSVCWVFMKVAEDVDVLKAACFDDVDVLNRHGLFQRTNGLLYRCAQVGNASAQFVLAKIVLMSSSRLWDMENEGAIFCRDHSPISNSRRGKIPLDDALAASFMSHFAPDQGCSTTILSQTLVHSQLVRTFLCHCSTHDLAQVHFHLQSYVDYFIKPYSRGWCLLPD